MTRQERLERVKTALKLLSEADLLIKEIVWESQEGQPDHFDKLPKLEQVWFLGTKTSISHSVAGLQSLKSYFLATE